MWFYILVMSHPQFGIQSTAICYKQMEQQPGNGLVCTSGKSSGNKLPFVFSFPFLKLFISYCNNQCFHLFSSFQPYCFFCSMFMKDKVHQPMISIYIYSKPIYLLIESNSGHVSFLLYGICIYLAINLTTSLAIPRHMTSRYSACCLKTVTFMVPTYCI